MPRKRNRRWAATPYDPARKAKRHIGTYATKSEARQAEEDWRRERRRRRVGEETCDSLVARWTRDYPRPDSDTNRHNRERVSLFGEDFKGVRLVALDRPTARKWAIDNPSRVPAVRAMYGDALNDGILEVNPFSNLRLPRSRGRRDIVALTEPELLTLGEIALAEHDDFGQLRAMILVAGYVGLRPGELFALRPDSLRGDLIDVEEGTSRAGESKQTKSRKVRTVIFPPKAQEAVEAMSRHHGRETLFATPRGRRFRIGSFGYYWRPIRSTFTASLPAEHALRRRLAADPADRLDPYELRHAAATMLLERGVSPWDVAGQLGHQDGGRLVCERYGHPAEKGVRQRLLAAYGVASEGSPALGSLAEKRRAVGDG